MRSYRRHLLGLSDARPIRTKFDGHIDLCRRYNPVRLQCACPGDASVESVEHIDAVLVGAAEKPRSFSLPDAISPAAQRSEIVLIDGPLRECLLGGIVVEGSMRVVTRRIVDSPSKKDY